MKTISFATTQMNLINCVEYLSTIKGVHTLYLMADTPTRQKQIIALLNNPAYSTIFSKIIRCPMTNRRIIDFVLTFIYLIRLRLLAYFNRYDYVVTGNYKNYGARLLFRIQKKKQERCELVVCDDGLATVAISKSRIEELKLNKPYIFCANRVLLLIHKNNFNTFIPSKIVYFTSYNIETVNNDRIIKNNYDYIKSKLECFNVERDFFNCKALLLGQPLYCKGYISKEKYKNKVIKYSKTVGEQIVYYAHPEEKESLWLELGIGHCCKFVNNYLPFEIIAAILPRGCRVASFFSSVLMNLRLMNDKLEPECIKLSKEDLINQDKYSALSECYNSYKQNNVRFYEFD